MTKKHSSLNRIIHIPRTFDPATKLPLVVVDSTCFPLEDYGEIIPKLIERLPQSDYALLFFACGAPNKPSWSWVAKAYAVFDRSVKKRIKRVYVVHESWWVRASTEMLRGVVSSKFKRKIVHVSSLSDLATHLDITLINIPPAVYSHNIKIEPHITVPKHHSPIFGARIRRHPNGNLLYPRFWLEATRYLSSHLPSSAHYELNNSEIELLDTLKDAYDRGQLLDLTDYTPELTLQLMKLYLQELPQPVLHPDAIPLPLQDTADYSAKVFMSLPEHSRYFLSDFIPLVYKIMSNSASSPSTQAAFISHCLTGASPISKEGIAIITRYSRNLIDFWPQMIETAENADKLDYSAQLASHGPFKPPQSRSSSVGSKIPPPIPPKRKSQSISRISSSSSILRPSSKSNIEGRILDPKSDAEGKSYKPVTSTKRGKMVAELAKLYEERGAAAQILVDIDRGRSRSK